MAGLTSRAQTAQRTIMNHAGAIKSVVCAVKGYRQSASDARETAGARQGGLRSCYRVRATALTILIRFVTF
eukprot:6032695-Prymnesium_polylepis.1